MATKKLLYFFFASLVLFGLGRLYYTATDDFRIGNVTYEIPHNPEWEIPALSAEEQSRLQMILSQEFHYLGRGAQSYAFVSEDGQYVLKLIKFKHIKPSLIMQSLPSIAPFDHYKEKHLERKNKILTGVFSGYHLAYETHREESGIIYIHLNRTSDLKKTLVLYDKVGVRRKVDLDHVVFVVQHRATKTRDVMRNALNSGDLALAKKRMRQIVSLYFSEYAKGIYDRDHGVMHNTGFVGDHPIHLDVGKLTRSEEMKDPDAKLKDFDKVVARFDLWIKANYPEAHSEMAQEMESAVAEAYAGIPS